MKIEKKYLEKKEMEIEFYGKKEGKTKTERV